MNRRDEINLPPRESSPVLAKKPDRRSALIQAGGGLAGIALAWLLDQQQGHAGMRPQSLHPRRPDFAPRAENVIFISMGGGPSHIDLFDPKPTLAKHDGQDIPIGIFQRGLSADTKLMASPFRFSPQGQSGIEMSELLPHLGGVADEIALIRSATTTRIDHLNAQFVLNTGRGVPGFPTIGSWITYGLGTVNQNLPAYVALAHTLPGSRQRAYSSGWLPPLFQGTQMKVDKAPIFDLQPPPEMTPTRQRKLIDFLRQLHQSNAEPMDQSLEFEARLSNFELAARMQTEVMEQVDLDKETQTVKRQYGFDSPDCGNYARYCLVARKLIESGVRFVHVLYNGWDHHFDLPSRLRRNCAETDQPVAALIADLKQRGLLDTTLVIWAGEFGRLPIAQRNNGRDHDPHGFSIWMAGAGIRGGTVLGATDEFGYAAVEDKVTPSDLHATILHLLGLDFKNLTYPFEGRDESLVGVNQASVLLKLIG